MKENILFDRILRIFLDNFMKNIFCVLILLMLLFSISCTVKVAVENNLPNTVYATLKTFHVDCSSEAELPSGEEKIIRFKPGPQNDKKYFYINWGSSESLTGRYEKIVTVSGTNTYISGGTTGWILNEEFNKVILKNTVSVSNSTGETYSVSMESNL